MTAKHENRNIRVLEFLNAYEKQESLWNPTLDTYKNKAARDEAYRNIINELNVPSLTINDVKLKVKSVRTTYTKELRLLTRHKELGKPYNPKLFWFNRANAFLKNVSLSRDRRTANFIERDRDSHHEYKPCLVEYIPHDEEHMDDSNVENDAGNSTASSYDYKQLQSTAAIIESQLSDGIAETEIQSEEEDVTSTKLLNNQTNEDLNQTVTTTDININDGCITEDSTNVHNSHANSNIVVTHSTPLSSGVSIDDDCEAFCRSVAAQLRSISDSYSRSVAKLKIQHILFEAETGHYRHNPCVISLHQNVSSLQEN